MALLTKAPRGTQDFTPEVTQKLQYIESTLMQTAQLFGFGEIRTPVFEHTELFTRSVGDTTDVVQKEMYTFEDKKGRSITLKPEGTAGTIRAALEHGMLGGPLPLKLSYVTPCFRYEKAQTGRYRQFHQFGVETVGAAGPTADAEAIGLVHEAFQVLGVEDIVLEINSIGCPNCRPKYQQALVEYFSQYKDELCETCLDRMDKNPLRLLDCKVPRCQEIAKDAPICLDYLCEECEEHFDGLKKRLEGMDIPYKINPTIVRGLDYYTKTVFEFISEHVGTQGTVCGGGRYDGLVEQVGGQPTPGVGFAMGLERLLMVMEAGNCPFPEAQGCDIYVAPIGGEEANIAACKLVAELRREGFAAEMDNMGRALRSQMKYADKIGAKYTLILGESELESQQAQLKNMTSGETTQVALATLCDQLTQVIFETYHTEIADAQILGVQ